jgi:hypothetical protein
MDFNFLVVQDKDLGVAMANARHTFAMAFDGTDTVLHSTQVLHIITGSKIVGGQMQAAFVVIVTLVSPTKVTPRAPAPVPAPGIN